jgi:hypothetical protein
MRSRFMNTFLWICWWTIITLKTSVSTSLYWIATWMRWPHYYAVWIFKLVLGSISIATKSKSTGQTPRICWAARLNWISLQIQRILCLRHHLLHKVAPMQSMCTSSWCYMMGSNSVKSNLFFRADALVIFLLILHKDNGLFLCCLMFCRACQFHW